MCVCDWGRSDLDSVTARTKNPPRMRTSMVDGEIKLSSRPWAKAEISIANSNSATEVGSFFFFWHARRVQSLMWYSSVVWLGAREGPKSMSFALLLHTIDEKRFQAAEVSGEILVDRERKFGEIAPMGSWARDLRGAVFISGR